jgi:hypothetical protein
MTMENQPVERLGNGHQRKLPRNPTSRRPLSVRLRPATISHGPAPAPTTRAGRRYMQTRWSAQSHPGYRGYAWYRKRIGIGKAATPLGIYIPAAAGAGRLFRLG